VGILTEDGNEIGTFSWRKMFAFSAWIVFMLYNVTFVYNAFTDGVTDIPKGVQFLLGIIFSFYFGKGAVKGIINKIVRKKKETNN